MKRKTILENAARVNHGYGSVVESLGIQLAPNYTERHVPQGTGGKADRVLEVPALHLKMMRAEIHSLGPDDSGQIFHSVRRAGIGLYFTIAAFPSQGVDVAA